MPSVILSGTKPIARFMAGYEERAVEMSNDLQERMPDLERFAARITDEHDREVFLAKVRRIDDGLDAAYKNAQYLAEHLEEVEVRD